MRFVGLMIFILPFAASATVISGEGLCPQIFEGRVEEIIDEVGPETAMSHRKVLFANRETLKGEVDGRVMVDVLKNGPFEFEKGKDYKVHLRRGRLCWVNELE